MKRRDANRVLVGLAAMGGGLFGYSFPLDLLDRVLVASGAATAMPLFAPPLGLTARILIIIGCMAITAALTAAVSPWKKGRARLNGEPQPFFSTMETSDDFVPVLRRSDAHPDAPARPPLFASRDLGHEALPPVMPGGPEGMSATFDRIWPKQGEQEEGNPDLRPTLEPMPWDTIQAEMDRLLSGVRFRPVDEASERTEEHAGRTGGEGDDQRVPSIQELIGRLERGLARRQPPTPTHGEQPSAERAAAPGADPTPPDGATVQVG